MDAFYAELSEGGKAERDRNILNSDIRVLRDFLTGVKAGKHYLEEDCDYMRGLLESVIDHAL